MNSPPRLLQCCSHLEARELLRAGSAEVPRASALRATALALGVSAGVAVTTAAGAAGATAAATSLAAPSLALVVGKWLAIGTFAGLALAAGANQLTSGGASSAVAPSQIALNPAPALPVLPRVAEARSETSTPQPADVSRRPTPPHKTTFAPRSEVAGARVEAALPDHASLPDGRDLGREVEQIDAARRAVAAGNARQALLHLDQYESLERTSTLDREALLLRVDALLLSGRKAEALTLARAYLSHYPGDPHSSRLHALVSEQ
jgi:hypothetical protein